jgi:hypothetical protein
MDICHSKHFGSRLLFYFYGFIMGIFLLTGCEKKGNSVEEKTDVDVRDAEVVRNNVLKSLHTSDVTNQLQFSSESFAKGLLNDVDRTNHYLRRGKGVAAANLGIYLSDLSCLLAHDRRDEAGRYFEACLALSKYIGMEKQFSQAIQFGFNEIIAGDEKLQKSLADEFKNATNTAQEEEFKKAHASALTGYYIEELYHLSFFLQSHNSVDQDSVFFVAFGVFMNQKDELNNLVTYFDHFKLKSEGISAYQDLLALQAKYFALDRDRLLRETNASHLLQDKSLMDIFDSLSSLRKRIIDF